jgi:enoyl-CoA hydratase
MAATDPELLLIEDREHVRILSLNRPDRHNALNDPLMYAYRDAVGEALADDNVRCIVLRGEGRSFCSGRDTADFGKHGSGEPVIEWLAAGQRTIAALLDSPKPIIAAMKGHVIGGGFEMCLAADIRIGAVDLRAALPEVGFASIPDNGGTQILTALVGPGRAKELVLAGRRINADEALAWGIVNRVVPVDELDAVVFGLAHEISQRSPLAVRLAKQLVDSCWADCFHRGLRNELVAQTAMFNSADYAEAGAARREQRAPTYTGR